MLRCCSLHLVPGRLNLLGHHVAQHQDDTLVQLAQGLWHHWPELLNEDRRTRVNLLAELLVDVVGIIFQDAILLTARRKHRHQEPAKHYLADAKHCLVDPVQPLVTHVGAKGGGHEGQKGLGRLVHSGPLRLDPHATVTGGKVLLLKGCNYVIFFQFSFK